jgi:hypothetical protein
MTMTRTFQVVRRPSLLSTSISQNSARIAGVVPRGAVVGLTLPFAYYTEAPLIVPDDARSTMLRERGYNMLSAAS